MYKLGDYVSTKRHSYSGRIYAKYHLFSETKESQGWFNDQIPQISKTDLIKSWYSILVKNGGAILVPESDIIEKHKPYKLNNMWEDFYFDDCFDESAKEEKTNVQKRTLPNTDQLSPKDIELIKELFPDLKKFIKNTIKISNWEDIEEYRKRIIIRTGLNVIASEHPGFQLSKLMISKWEDVVEYIINVL